ncbi:MAG: hypothetical protein P8Y47_08415 [Alphaproteobacteria bacterium]
MPTADDFRRELEARFQQALEIGAPHIDVVSGDLHRAVGGYPTPKPRMPNCCSVMNQEFDPDCDEILSEKVSHGARLAYRYKLPRNESRASKRSFGARVEERREQANGHTMRPADQSTVYNFNIERSVIGANGNTVIADNVGNVSQTATINIGQCLQDIDGLKSQLNWAGSERHQQIIQQLPLYKNIWLVEEQPRPNRHGRALANKSEPFRAPPTTCGIYSAEFPSY